MSFQERVAFIWGLADLLRGDYKDAEYAKVILPFTVLRRLDCALDAQSLDKLKEALLDGFHPAAQDVMDCFDLRDQIPRLRLNGLLSLLIERFSQVDLHPATVSNHEMGSIFEELIRRFSEQSGSSGGEHFTPREVIRLMVDLLFVDLPSNDEPASGTRTLYDPACGTGGMLSVAEDYLREQNSGVRLEVFGQELNRESYAICKADLLMRGASPDHVHLGNTFLRDELAGERFDYMLSNPPFGVEWKKAESVIREEHQRLGFAGRFGAGLPRVNDGSLLFLQHMLSKMKPEGSRLAVVFNGSPLFAGDAGSGESDIRRWILENDWLEAIVALPDQLFYNTGLYTYIWVLTNRKSDGRKDKVQLIDATGFSRKMRRSLGAKRNEISPEQIREIVRIHTEFRDQPHSRIVNKQDFLYSRIIVERPLRLNFQASPERASSLDAATAAILAGMDSALTRDQSAFEQALARRFRAAGVKLGRVLKNRILHALGERDCEAAPFRGPGGKLEPDPDLRDSENVPWGEDIAAWFEREVLPHAPDAWIDDARTRIGCEIPFTRIFHELQPLATLPRTGAGRGSSTPSPAAKTDSGAMSRRARAKAGSVSASTISTAWASACRWTTRRGAPSRPKTAVDACSSRATCCSKNPAAANCSPWAWWCCTIMAPPRSAPISWRACRWLRALIRRIFATSMPPSTAAESPGARSSSPLAFRIWIPIRTSPKW
ncbi:MAG: SAM-dependent DNA methyltransferase [Candidatus Solibacter usitatus]|nr:SAM-dependent DNA methyltransferase [Candidatus Solibacter usitatus]